MSSHFSYELDNLQSWELIEGIHASIEDKENNFKNFRDLGSKVRNLIHGIPSSFQASDFSVAQLEIYIGCARADRLYQRFSQHKKNKGHEFGVIIGMCPSDQVKYLERVSILFIKKLEEKGHLCVRNAKIQGYDQDTTDEKILTYMTFKIDRRISDEWTPPNKPERDDIYKALLKEIGPNIDGQPQNWREHIKSVIDDIHKKSSKETLSWHKNHR